MSSVNGEFYLNDGHLSDAEVDLIGHFIRYVARRYQINPEDIEFKFRAITIGMSATTKLIAHARNIYPYFIKIGDKNLIKKETSHHNMASARIPPLYVPPLETVIDGDIAKYKTEASAGSALVAYRYISGRNKGQLPVSLMDAFPDIGKYRMIELIDELFGVVLSDFHAFADAPVLKPFEHLIHNKKRFAELKIKRLNTMITKYNKLAENGSCPLLPHGMVHGDLHCENVIVNRKLSPIIIDFEMMRQQGCLLNDFAEFEVALIVAALESNTDFYGPVAEMIYSRKNMFEVFGVDKLSRCVRSIRANLADMIFRESGFHQSPSAMHEIEGVYNSLLLRYLCSYSYVAKKSLSKERGTIVFSGLEELFELKLSSYHEQSS